MKSNEEILKERTEALNAIRGARVGDYLKLPNGKFTRFTHRWDDHIQTGGVSESFYLGNGYVSYSGGLDPGVKLKDLIKTNEIKAGLIWIFKNDYHTAHNEISYLINFRVYKLRKGANLTGLFMPIEDLLRVISKKSNSSLFSVGWMNCVQSYNNF